MANIDNGFRVEILSLDDLALVGTGEAEPNIGIGYDAPQGSLYMRQNAGTDGQLWVKKGPADVDWGLIDTYNPLNGGNGTKQNSSTGIIEGGTLSINVDPTKFDISAGKGIIVDHTASPLDPTFNFVIWPAFTGITASNLGITSSTDIMIDISGSVIQSGTPVSNLDHKTMIYIGILGHVIPSTQIQGAISGPDPAYGGTERLGDLSRALGPININGNIYVAEGANLQLQKSSGNTHSTGINFLNSIEDPDTSADPFQALVQWNYAKQDGTGGFNIDTNVVNTLDPTLYDDGSGTLVAVPSGQWTVQVVHYFAGANETRIEYGQQLFSTLNSALEHLPDPEHQSNPVFGSGVIRSFIALSGSATDLTNPADAKIIEGAKFGSGAGGQFTSSITDLQQAYLNSIDPEIVTDSILGAITITEGLAVGGNLIEGKDDTNALVFTVDTTGALNNTNIEQLSNVVTTTPANTEVLTFNGTNWVNAPGGAGGGLQNIVEDITPELGANLDALNNRILNLTDPIGLQDSATKNYVDIHTHTITDMTDVLTTMTPVDGQVLTFDTTNGWQAETPATGGGGALNDLTEVIITTPSDKSVIQYNSTLGQWENIDLQTFTQGLPTLISSGSIQAVTGTATIPLVATAPLSTQGVPIWSSTITPNSATASEKISTSISFAVSKASQSFIVALFRDNVCIGTMVDTASGTKTLQTISFTVQDIPGVTTPITYECRVGTKASATWWVNSLDTPLLGGTLENNSFTIEEVD